jgi:hypothetical protein
VSEWSRRCLLQLRPRPGTAQLGVCGYVRCPTARNLAPAGIPTPNRAMLMVRYGDGVGDQRAEEGVMRAVERIDHGGISVSRAGGSSLAARSSTPME